MTRLEISTINRHDIEVSATLDDAGWIVIRLRSATLMPVRIDRLEELRLIMTPTQRELDLLPTGR